MIFRCWMDRNGHRTADNLALNLRRVVIRFLALFYINFVWKIRGNTSTHSVLQSIDNFDGKHLIFISGIAAFSIFWHLPPATSLISIEFNNKLYTLTHLTHTDTPGLLQRATSEQFQSNCTAISEQSSQFCRFSLDFQSNFRAIFDILAFATPPACLLFRFD